MKLEDFKLGGTDLKASDFKQGRVLTTEWEPDLRYAWDNGVAIGRYLAELKAGRIIARACHKCRRVMLPPRMFCELCFRPTDEWMYVRDTGVVNTFSIALVNWDASRRGPKEPPLIPAVIEIDGASRQMGILHMLGEVDPQAITVGMKVRAVWKDPAERTGAITDILYFKPVSAPAARAGARRKAQDKSAAKTTRAGRGKR